MSDANLARFRAYQRKGELPSNTYAAGQLNVWRDEAGHLCAAATIINASGAVALVEQVAEESNFIRLADVTSGPLMDWILTSGTCGSPARTARSKRCSSGTSSQASSWRWTA